MEVSPEVLEVLKCSSCKLYLFQGPVFLQHDGATACGRCYTPQRSIIRNTLYEVTARFLNLKFPCKNREFGCLETVSYLEQDEMIVHENVCEHQQFVCPVLSSTHCDWLGPKAAMLAHCRDQHPDIVLEKCARCAVEVTMFLYRGVDGWRCESCAPARRACENQGCTYTDIYNKCIKHEYFFCEQRTQCYICEASLPRGSLSAHYGSVHQDITHRAGSTWRVTQGWEWCFVSSVAGTAVCGYFLDDLLFELYVRIPVSNVRLGEFRCEMCLTDPDTGHARTFTLNVYYDALADWYIMLMKEAFPSWNTKLDICVEIRKTESLNK